MSSDHEFVQIGDRLGVLTDLLLGRRVKDSKSGVHVPFVGVDAQGNVDLHVLNTAHPSPMLPRELLVGLPRSSHAQEGCVSDSLCIRSNAVVHLAGEVDMCRSETGEDVVNELKAFVRGSVLDEDLYCIMLLTDDLGRCEVKAR